MSHGVEESGTPTVRGHVSADTHGFFIVTIRAFAFTMAAWALVFLANNVLNFWYDWPGTVSIFGQFGLFGATAVDGGPSTLSWLQFATYIAAMAAVILYTFSTPSRSLHDDSEFLGGVTGYIIRAAFWSVLLIGLVDGVISFLRVEGLLSFIIGADMAEQLGRPNFRGQFVHYPLIVIGLIIAAVRHTLGFYWLAVLIVAAELAIVIARFVFSYEQAFMADLVRFWYGALFLFASPYTLIKEGHVRVDILYAGFSDQGRALANSIGCVLLGLPLCWVILTLGMWGKASAINGPLLSFEVTQSGFGLYTKYLLAGYLLVFALAMLIQFMGYLLSNIATYLHEPGHKQDLDEHATV